MSDGWTWHQSRLLDSILTATSSLYPGEDQGAVLGQQESGRRQVRVSGGGSQWSC